MVLLFVYLNLYSITFKIPLNRSDSDLELFGLIKERISYSFGCHNTNTLTMFSNIRALDDLHDRTLLSVIKNLKKK